MSPQRRSLVMVVSLVLCGPVLLDALRGDVPLGSAGARYGLALVLTWAAARGLDHLVTGYRVVAPERPGAVPGDGDDEPTGASEPSADRRQRGPAPAAAAPGLITTPT
ncbi:MAG: hypothetical protein WD232_00155 [Acidimicrobiales bacterium]